MVLFYILGQGAFCLVSSEKMQIPLIDSEVSAFSILYLRVLPVSPLYSLYNP